MASSRLLWALFLLPLLKACAPEPGPPAAAAAPLPLTGTKAVLIAGDGRLPVFDNAVDGVAARLRAHGGSPAGDIQRLSADGAVVATGKATTASLSHVLQAVVAMKPAPGQGCFVYATAHGGQGRGLWLQLTDEYLTPQALDAALTLGCGNAPTAVVISSCFSGIFAHTPMDRPNRVVLTAARPDRTSFGCAAGRTYTAFDACFLNALDAGGTWSRAFAAVQACVHDEERRNDVAASEPQAWFGAGAAGLMLPVRVTQ